MKIKYLWVSKYKNLKNIDLNFDSDLVTLLVGRNGLGKSNLIEILALIFRELDLVESEEKLLSWSYYDDRGQFEFIINYECFNWDIKFTVKEGEYLIETWNETKNHSIISLNHWKKNRHKYLPNNIIGYYSGENKRINEIIYPHAKLEQRLQKNWHRRKTLPERGLRRLFFAENKHSQLILITLAIYRENPQFKGLIDLLFNKYLGIQKIDAFDIRFNNPRSKFYKKIKASADYFEENFISSKSEIKYPFWNLKGKVHDLISILFNHHLEFSTYLIYNNEGEDKRRFVKEFLELKNTTIERIQPEIYEKFAHPIEFFNALESTYNLEILSEISVSVTLNNSEKEINFSQLSEGQQQIIAVIGMILITGRDESLFLLDEPDTHINPRWQRDYVKLLSDFNLNGLKSQILVATHSPLIVQSSENADVFLFKNNNNDIIIDTAHHQIHNWRIDQVLQSDYFDFDSTRPAQLDDFMERREGILNKTNITKEDLEYLKKLDEEMGQLPSGETLNDFRTLNTLYKIVQSNRNE